MDTLRAEPWIRRLDSLCPLAEEDRAVLREIAGGVIEVGADQDLLREGERPTNSNVLLDGMTFRYRLTPEGRRQILSFHVPGDLFDAQSYLLEEMDHSVGTLTPVRLALLPHRLVTRLTEEHPRIARAFWKATLVDAAITREWMVSLGRRTARQALAHLLCELVERLAAVGLAQDQRIELPLTQSELADALGLSSVHVNRTLQELRREGLIALSARELQVRDWDGLAGEAAFNPRYLHQAR